MVLARTVPRTALRRVFPAMRLWAAACAFFWFSAAWGQSVSLPLQVGSEVGFPPYADVDEKGRARGFSIDLFSAVARVMGLPVTYRVSDWDGAWNGLLSGKLDALPIVARLKERDGLLDYTTTHTVGYDGFFVRKGSLPIRSIDAARGRRIIVMRADAGHHALKGHGLAAELVFSDTLPDAMRLLASGQHDAVLAPLVQGTLILRERGLDTLVLAGPPLAEYRREYAIAVKKGNTILRDQLDQGLLIVKASGEYERIYEKWLGLYEPHRFPVKYLVWGGSAVGGALLLFGVWNWSLRRSRERLRLSEERLQLALKATNVVVWDWDVRRDAEVWHGASPEGFGWQEIVDLPQPMQWWTERIHPDDRDRVMAGLDAAVADPQTHRWQDRYRFQCRDGRFAEVFDSGNIQRDREGRATRMIGSIQDVTRHVERETALRLAQERLNLAQRAAHCGLWDVNLQTREMYWSDEFSALYGLDPKTVRPRLEIWQAALHPDDREAAIEAMAEAARSHTRLVNEYRILRPSGEECWIHAYGEVASDAPDKPLRMLGISIDATERRRAADALIRQKSLYDMLAQCNQAVLRCRNRDEMFAEACRIAVECAGFRFAWVGLGRAGEALIDPGAQYGSDTDYVVHARVSAQADSPNASSPMGQAILNGKAFVSNDFANDPATKPWHDAARRAGFGSAAAFPFAEQGSVIGALAMYAGEPGYFTDELLPALDQMAQDMSFALDKLQGESRRVAAEQALRESARFVRATFDALPAQIAVLNEHGTIIAVNRAWRDLAEAHASAPANACEGANYFAACRAAAALDAGHAASVAGAIRAVMDGESPQRLVESRCDGPDAARWFKVQVSRFPGDGPLRIVVAHEDITERKRADNAMRALLRGTTAVGDGFFAALVRESSAVLGARCVFVAELQPATRHLRSLALWRDGQQGENVDYPLAQAPIATAAGDELAYVPEGVRSRFPADQLLQDLDAEAYLAAPLFASDGKRLGLLAVVHDRPLADAEIALTLLPIFAARAGAELERLRTIAALRRNEEDLRVTLRSIGDAVIATDTEEGVMFMNPVAEALTGWGEEEARGRPLEEVFRILDEDTRQTVASPAARVLREGKVVGLANHTLLVARDGTECPIADSGAPIRLAADEQPTGVVLVFRDQTRERRHIDALAESERRFRTLFEQAAVGVAQVTADDDCFVRVNRRFAEILGCEDADLIGKPFELVLPPEDIPPHRNKLADFVAGRAAEFHMEERYLRKNGEAVWVEVSVSPMWGPDEPPDFCIVVAEDITARKRAEEQLRSLQEDLEQRVRERTAELAGAMRELESFSYTVSHDLRAPLRAINGYSKLLLEDEADNLGEAGRAHLDRVVANTIKMERLIDDILEYSRAGRQPLVFKEVDVRVLVTDLIGDLREDNPRAEVIVGDLPQATGDPIMLKQIFANLIGNALKFSSRCPRPRVEIGTLREEDGKTVYFVKDNGVGFDERYAGKLFGMFQRLHRDLEFPGTGVGLVLVKRLVERHRGRIWAQSEPDEGATFLFTLGG